MGCEWAASAGAWTAPDDGSVLAKDLSGGSWIAAVRAPPVLTRSPVVGAGAIQAGLSWHGARPCGGVIWWMP